MNLTKENIDAIKAACTRHHIKKLFVIGSAARNTMPSNSDVDLLYSFKEGDIAEKGYADNFFEFKYSLQKILKTKIDLVAQDYLKNHIALMR